MKKHPELYLVSPEAAVIHLGPTLLETLMTILTGSKRSTNFIKRTNLLLKKEKIPEKLQIVDERNSSMFQVHSLAAFITLKGFNTLYDLFEKASESKSAGIFSMSL